MRCLDENQAIQYVEGLLPADQDERVAAHLAECDDCRWLVTSAGAAALAEASSVAVTLQTDEAQDDAERAGDGPRDRRGEVLHQTYVITRFIGKGAMGEVYEASHTRLPKRFAVKFLSGPGVENRDAIARMRREAEVTSRLSHPHIVDVVDFNHSDDGTPFMVMDLLEGESLAERLRREGPLRDLVEVGEIVRQVTSALEAAHRQGVIHRDLKPSHLFLCRRDASGPWVKLLDFGLSKILLAREAPGGWKGQLTRVGTVLGSPGFMSPEQALGQSAEADARADIFSLGATLYKALSGCSPFVGRSLEEILAHVAHGEVQEVDSWRAIPRPIRRVIWRALRKDPAARQASMGELAEEFASAVREAQGRARAAPPELRSSTASQGRRARRGWVLALGVVALGSLGAVMAWRFGSRPVDGERSPGSRIATATTTATATATTTATTTATATTITDARVRGAVERERPAVSAERTVEPRPEPPVSDPSRVRVRTARRSAVVRSAVGQATLLVQSKEAEGGAPLWADVYLDGRMVGQTALTLRGLAAGVHRVELRRAGYRSAARRVVLEPGENARVRFALERASAANQ
ncbi:MAG: protein kinase [Deltaproteobacteria bacterium]|nr:protein kinase [Deltaproteobacteria bacterium]